MYTRVDDLKIKYDFNEGILVDVKGPEILYFAELREYTKNNHIPKFLEGHQINKTHILGQAGFDFLKIGVEFFIDFEFLVYKFNYDLGLQLVYQHRYDDRGKYIQFNLVTDDFEEALLWEQRVLRYVELHGCIPLIKSNFEEINHRHKSFFLSHRPPTYRTYNIGRFPKRSRDFKTFDHRKKGLLWFGNWKTIWSYQHPRPWTSLTPQEIADDILGLT
jgi:hypothetical protein